MDSVHFLQPARLGEVVRFRGRVLGAFRSSIEVGVTVEADNASTGKSRRCRAEIAHLAG